MHALNEFFTLYHIALCCTGTELHLFQQDAGCKLNCHSFINSFIMIKSKMTFFTFLIQAPFSFISIGGTKRLFSRTLYAHKQQTLSFTCSSEVESLRSVDWCFSLRCLNQLSVTDCTSVYAACVERLALSAFTAALRPDEPSQGLERENPVHS